MRTHKSYLGVVVGRFQVPRLHAGHKAVMNAALAGSKKVLVLVGSLGHGAPALTEHDPLDFETRRAMIARAYPNVTIEEIRDERKDEDWSKTLDATIKQHAKGKSVMLFGGRGCFRENYNGTYQIRAVKEVPYKSGTADRKAVKVRATEDFRRGVIYAANTFNKYRPRTFHCVDIALVDFAWSPGKGESKGRVLMGYKANQVGLYRFPGGFVHPHDKNTQAAAARELQEETGFVTTKKMQYIGNFNISDWRYKRHALFTDFFVAKWNGEPVAAADDLGTLEWVPLEKLQTLTLTDSHEMLAKALLDFVKERKTP